MAHYPNLADVEDLQSFDHGDEAFESDSGSEYEEVGEEEDDGECTLRYDEYGQLLDSGEAKPAEKDTPGVPTKTSTEPEKAGTVPHGQGVVDLKEGTAATSSTEETPYTKCAWITVKRGTNGRMGVTLRKVGKKIFLAFVEKGSEAAKAGLGFGDQVLAIQGCENFGRSGSSVMQWLKGRNSSQFTFKVQRRPYDFTVKALQERPSELSFYNKSEMHLGTIPVSRLARTGCVKEFRIIAVDATCVVGYGEGDLAVQLQKNPNSAKTFRLMPLALYRQLVKHQSKDRLKKHMQLAPLK